jgi:hypothetical protein
MQIKLPSLFFVKDSSKCTVNLQDYTGYTCVSVNATRTITIGSFTKTVMPANTKFTFSVNNIINPGWTTENDLL